MVNSFMVSVVKQSGAVEACWAHNPEVRRSKLRSAMFFFRKSPAFDALLDIKTEIL